MKKSIISLLSFILIAVPTLAQFDSAPAFPGAEGHGRYTTGGRGGKVYHVTNLKDSGTGSLRWALSQSGKKIIVFDVSGYIDLASQLNVSSNTTILGQTAPGDGITLRYYTLYFGNCDNVIVRYIRSRRSQIKDVNDGADATWGRRRHNIVIDHCSFSWSIDEVASFYDNRDFTMQWCTIAEGLANPGHSKGEHSYGGIWGGKCASFHHNMIAHVQNRAPRLNGARYGWDGYDKTKYRNTIEAEIVDLRNNLMYNWGRGNGAYAGMGGYQNIVNNYYKAGPATVNKTRVFQCGHTTGASSDQGSAIDPKKVGIYGHFYISGNYVTAATPSANYDWKGVIVDDDPTGAVKDSIRLSAPAETGWVTTHKAEVAYQKILDYCGASLKRDAVDERYMNEAKNGTTTYKGEVSNYPGIVDYINNPAKNENYSTRPSYPALATETRPADYDTDGDGMPDWWETKYGLDPTKNDALLYTLDEKKYYQNIEVYANSIVEDLVKQQRADAEDSFEEYYPVLDEISGIIEVMQPDSEGESMEKTFDLSGRAIGKDAKGIVIRKGKKTLR